MRTPIRLLALLILTSCASPPPPAAPALGAHFDPAPMPFVQYHRQTRGYGALELPIPPKMPPGTGAVPVSSSPVRGSIVTGFHEAF